MDNLFIDEKNSIFRNLNICKRNKLKSFVHNKSFGMDNDAKFNKFSNKSSELGKTFYGSKNHFIQRKTNKNVTPSKFKYIDQIQRLNLKKNKIKKNLDKMILGNNHNINLSRIFSNKGYDNDRLLIENDSSHILKPFYPRKILPYLIKKESNNTFLKHYSKRKMNFLNNHK